MKKVFWALGLTMVFNVAGTAQKERRDPPPVKEPETEQVNPGKQRSSTASTEFSAVSNVQAVLQSTIDARNANVGDEVVLKTTQSVKQNGEVVIPKGTELVGRITEVQHRTKNGAASKIGLVFERLQGRGLSVPIAATIVSITDLRAASSVGDTLDSDISSSSTSSTRTSSGSSGGGLLGGVTNTVGGLVNSTTQTVGTVTNTATNTVSGTTQALGKTLNGIQISSSASGSAQNTTTLSSQNKDVRLEKGVTFNLNVQKNSGN